MAAWARFSATRSPSPTRMRTRLPWTRGTKSLAAVTAYIRA
jgi:hypothetical protein